MQIGGFEVEIDKKPRDVISNLPWKILNFSMHFGGLWHILRVVLNTGCPAHNLMEKRRFSLKKGDSYFF
jgi:hypothetical protein